MLTRIVPKILTRSVATGSEAVNNVVKRAATGAIAIAALNRTAGKVGVEGSMKKYLLVFSAGVLTGQLFGLDLTNIEEWKKNPMKKIDEVIAVSTSPLPEKTIDK